MQESSTSVEYVVYRVEGSSGSCGETVTSSQGFELVKWKPSLTRIVPNNIQFEKIGFLKNWFFHLPRLFSNKRLYCVYSLVSDNEVLCQCMLTPASSRYPFMAPEDMQFGLVFTSPKHRNKKLANVMVMAIMSERESGGAYWWLTEVENIASRKLAERVGLRLVGKAARKSKMGFSSYHLIHG